MGAWTLNGDSSNYTGTLLHSAGVMTVNTTLGAALLRVREGSTLLGSGSLLGALVVEGRLNPGNSAGLFTVAGPVSFAPGSIAAFDIDGTGTGNGPGNYSRLVSASTVNIQGGSLVPILRGITGEATNAFTPVLGQRFRVISAQGEIVGSFSELQQPAGLPNGYSFDTLYSSNALELVVTAADFAQLTALGVGPTPNRIRTGAAIQAIRPLAGTRNPNPDTSLFFRELYSSDAAGITRGLDQIGTPIYGQVLEGSLSSWRQSAKSATRPRHNEEPIWLDMGGIKCVRQEMAACVATRCMRLEPCSGLICGAARGA
jgi:hypothetical protein